MKENQGVKEQFEQIDSRLEDAEQTQAEVTRDEKVHPAEPDWSGKCEVCGQSPTVPETGMCGPCTFGEADTAFGNW